MRRPPKMTTVNFPVTFPTGGASAANCERRPCITVGCSQFRRERILRLAHLTPPTDAAGALDPAVSQDRQSAPNPHRRDSLPNDASVRRTSNQSLLQLAGQRVQLRKELTVHRIVGGTLAMMRERPATHCCAPSPVTPGCLPAAFP